MRFATWTSMSSESVWTRKGMKLGASIPAASNIRQTPVQMTLWQASDDHLYHANYVLSRPQGQSLWERGQHDMRPRSDITRPRPQKWPRGHTGLDDLTSMESCIFYVLMFCAAFWRNKRWWWLTLDLVECNMGVWLTGHSACYAGLTTGKSKVEVTRCGKLGRVTHFVYKLSRKQQVLKWASSRTG